MFFRVLHEILRTATPWPFGLLHKLFCIFFVALDMYILLGKRVFF